MKRRVHTEHFPCKKICRRPQCVDTGYREEDTEKVIHFTDSTSLRIDGIDRAIVDENGDLRIFSNGSRKLVLLQSKEDVKYITRILEYFYIDVQVPKTPEYAPSYIS